MPDRFPAWLCSISLALFLVACGSQTEGGEAPSVTAVPIAGMYEVSGVTVTERSGEKRRIAGKIILAEHDGRYTATFDLTTEFPMGGETFPAEVIGKGEGVIEGRQLVGTAETQLVVATVPGVDTAFAFLPRQVSTRIRSTSTATIAPDGTLVIEIENQPAAGEEYAPTRTTLRGSRISAAGLGNTPEVAAAPPDPD
jgi:hypothetical protein